MDNGTLFNMKDLNAKGAEERNAVLVRAQAALKTLGEVRPLITVAPKRTGGICGLFPRAARPNARRRIADATERRPGDRGASQD